jgi:hypothetical protein
MSVVYPYGNLTVGGGGAGSGQVSTIANGAGSTYATANATWANSNTAKMTAKGELHLEGENADIVVNGVRLSETLRAINERLSILEIKPELHSKYDNLRQAYEHYKTLEALLYEQEKAEK